jgi:Glycosyl transferase family 2
MPPSPPPPATTRDVRPSPTVSVVIPALNEETNLPLVLEGLPPVDEVVIVDGGSADDTVAVAREVRPDAVVVRQTRTGKGNALICGFAASRGDIVVTLNADGSTDPGEIPRYVDALISGAEVAHGSRYRDGGGNLVGRPLDRFGNAVLSRLVNALFGTRFTDLGYGYNAYWRSLLPALDLPGVDVPGLKRGQRLWGDGPEIEPLINIRVAAQGMRVVEVASIGYPPIHGVREHRMLRRALRALRAAFAEYIRRWRIGHLAAAGPANSAATAGRRRGTATGPARPEATAQHPRFGPPVARSRQDTDTGSHQRGRDSGSHPRGLSDTGSHQRIRDRGSHPRGLSDDTGTHQRIRETGTHPRGLSGDTGSHLRGLDSDTGSHVRGPGSDTGSHPRRPGSDTGSHLRSVGDDGRETTGARRADPRGSTGPSDDDRRRTAAQDDWRTTTGSGREKRRETTGAGQDDWRTTTGSGQDDWRTTTGSGQDDWRTTTGSGREKRRETTGAGQDDWRTTTGSGQDDWRTTTGSGRGDWRTTTGGGGGGRPGWREITDTGQWQDLTGAAPQERSDGPRYDPAAADQQQHDLDPAARRSLPMYPDPDPTWAETSGRHAAAGESPADRRDPRSSRQPPQDEPAPGGRARRGAADRPRGYRPDDRPADRPADRLGDAGPAPWQGSTSDTGSHHRIEPDSDGGPRGPSGDDQGADHPPGPRRPRPRPSGPGPSGSGPTGLGPTGLGPTGLGPTGLGPTGLGPTGLGPTGLGPTGLGPTGLDSTGLGSERGWAPDLGRTQRDVGGRRRRMESWERRLDGRPGLTVITGEGLELTDPNRPTHLRALPGERYRR